MTCFNFLNLFKKKTYQPIFIKTGDSVINKAFSRRMRRPIMGLVTDENDLQLQVLYPFSKPFSKDKSTPWQVWAPRNNFIKAEMKKENFLAFLVRKLFKL